MIQRELTRSEGIPSIAAIIPAYNEERGIKQVLNVLCETDVLRQIIVVNDGSQDNTAEISQAYSERDKRIRLINHPSNLGKGQAVFDGIHSTEASIIVTLDADLVGLTCQHIECLVSPVIEGQADMTIGVFQRGQWNTDISHWISPWLSGQRCLPNAFLRNISWDAAAGYGLETAITIAARHQNWRCVKVGWRGVSHPSSEFHRGIGNGIVMRTKMYSQILRAWYLATQNHTVSIKFQIFS